MAVLSLTPANVEAVVADIEGAGGAALGVVCDISDADQIKAAVRKVVDAYGGIDILVNNAFDATVVLSPILDLSVEQLPRNFEMGPIAYLKFMQASYPYSRPGVKGVSSTSVRRQASAALRVTAPTTWRKLILLSTDLALVTFPNDTQPQLIEAGFAAARQLGYNR